jgi:hypothetical protein
MSTKQKKNKPYWEMTTAELREATREFDEEMVIDKSKPLTPEMRAWWKRFRRTAKRSNGQQLVAVRLDKKLLDRCQKLAKKKRITPDDLIARGLRAILAAEGEV